MECFRDCCAMLGCKGPYSRPDVKDKECPVPRLNFILGLICGLIYAALIADVVLLAPKCCAEVTRVARSLSRLAQGLLGPLSARAPRPAPAHNFNQWMYITRCSRTMILTAHRLGQPFHTRPHSQHRSAVQFPLKTSDTTSIKAFILVKSVSMPPRTKRVRHAQLPCPRQKHCKLLQGPKQ